MDVLVIGLGSIASKHIAAMRSIQEEINIYALRSGINNKSVEGVNDVYDLKNIKPDFAIISNPTNLHYATIKQMAELKIPMLVEKPVLSDLINKQSLVDLISTNNVFTYVACNLRFHPCLQYLKKHISTKRNSINEVNIYCGSYLPDWRPNRNFREIYSVDPTRGGGVHLDLFHEMDYAVWIFGYPNASSGFQSNKSTLAIAASDYANYILTYDTFNISIVLNYYRKKAKRSIEIVFENEIWNVDLLSGKINNDSNVTIFESPDFQITSSYNDQMRFFIDSLNANRDTGNSVSDSINILQISLKNDAITK